MGGEGRLTGIQGQEVTYVYILSCGGAAMTSSHAHGYI